MKIIGNSWLVAGALGWLGLSVGCAGSAVGGDGASGGGNVAGAPAAGAGSAAGAGVDCALQPVPLEQFPEQLAAVLCDGVAPCCSAANVPYTETSCKSNALQAALQLLPDPESPNLAYVPAGAARCLCAMQQELASCQNFDDFVETVCEGMLVGTLPVGSTCKRSQDCAPPGYCKIDPNHVDQQTCSEDGGSNYPRGKVGDPCVGFCDSEQNLCSALGPTAIGNYCERAEGLYCASDSKQCKKLGLVGEPCAPYDNGCANGEYCSAAGRCAAQTDSGQCNDGGSAACTSDSYCADGQCHGPRKADGQPCLQSAECSGNICVGGDGVNPGRCTRESAARGHRCEGGLK